MRSDWPHSRSGTHIISIEPNARTDSCSICYSVALFISTSKPSKQDGNRSCASLIDFRGFLDLRYTVLCIGTFFAILGLWMPSYYISMLKIPFLAPLFTAYHLPETYANVAYPNNKIGEYFLCIMNGTSILGAIV